MSDEPIFRTDLFRGTAEYYERYRLPYPESMISDLARRTGADGQGRLLDLACGTGQLAFALRPSFAEVWAVDQEPDMIAKVRAKAGEDAGAASSGRLVSVVASAEELDAPAGHFSLIAIGNAFHRLRRDQVARLTFHWLAPGGFIALCWSPPTQGGPRDWQTAFGALLRRWQDALGCVDRVPANWNQVRRQRPDALVLSEAGFEVAAAGQHEFPVSHDWTLPELAGFARSLSMLPADALASQGTAFDDSLAAALGPFVVDGHLTETGHFAYELARKPR